MTPDKANILVLCTGNSCRSQMAEGFLRQMAGDRFEVHSAGTRPKDRVEPLAVQVMAEAGVDIRAQRPKDLRPYLGRMNLRYLIVVCDRAEQECPRVWPGLHARLHWPFADPAEAHGPLEERLAVFRRVRDQIRQRIQEWLRTVPDDPAA